MAKTGKHRSMIPVLGFAGYATQLNEANAEFAKVVQLLNGTKLEDVLLPLVGDDYAAIERLAVAAEGLLKAAQVEVTAFNAGRKSEILTEWERTKRDTARRQKKKAAAGVTPKKRGRPAKKGA